MKPRNSFLMKLQFARYEVTTLRSKLRVSLREISRSCCNPFNFVGALCKFLSWLLITTFVIIFWQVKHLTRD